jgi:hypothetical protein
MKQTFNYGSWFIEYTPEDGARLDRLCYNDFDLITTEPEIFKAPAADYGEYEKRPVYGYDDCFPSVEVSEFPGLNWKVPDHGEVCWLKWDVENAGDRLIFSVHSKSSPLHLKRELVFSESKIIWNYEVHNKSSKKIPFQHVMHPLMKLDEISGVQFPNFQSVYNRTTNKNLSLKNSSEVQDFLLNQPLGTATMLFLRGIKDGKMSWSYKNGQLIKTVFPENHFSSIGIWWNNKGYPDEPGIKRNECAFEPIPGFTSSLSEAFNENRCLWVEGNNRFKWQVAWEISS